MIYTILVYATIITAEVKYGISDRRHWIKLLIKMASTENLPNLKISVENSGENDDVVQLEDIDQNDSLNLEENNESQVEVKVNLDTLAPANNQVVRKDNLS